MVKSLNIVNNTCQVRLPGRGERGQSTYESSVPRVAFALAGVALTAITIAASVILPAKLDLGSREPRLSLASHATPPASNVDGGPIMSITVVAARERRLPTAPLRIVETGPRQPGETTSSAILRISSAAQ